jgi:hypothetical protein
MPNYNKAMSAAKSQKNPDIPADLQPYYDAPSRSRTWARWAVRIVALIICILLAIMFVKWVWHQTHAGDTNKPATGTSQNAGKSATGQHSTKPITLGGSSEGDNSTSSNPDTGSGNTGAATQSVGQSADLTNTGPGETLAVFVAASLFFALIYELRLRKIKT